ncbi:TPA: type IV secretion system DNA-binding domain-containing protein [Vibrio cholerae]
MAKTGTTNNLIRGGQQFTLELNMFLQNFKNHFKIILFFSAIIFVLISIYNHDETDRKWAVIWAKSYVNTQVLKGNINKTYEVDNGKNKVNLTWQQYYSNPSVIERKDSFVNSIYTSFWYSVFAAFFMLFLHVRYIIRKGAKSTNSEHVRGSEFSDIKEVDKQLKLTINSLKKERGESFLQCFGLPLIQGAECSGIALCGSPGVGKSTELFSIADQFRKQGKRMFIYDMGGEFVSRYYREGKDHILNPLDKRSKNWDVWAEGKDIGTYSTICRALIPESKSGDPIWYTAPRSVLTHVIAEVGMKTTNPEIANILRVIYRMDTKTMAKVLKSTDANAMFNTEAEKFAASIRGIIGSYAEALRYLKSGGERFSIKEWLRNDDDDSWVFVSVTDEHSDILAPLITVWFEIFASTALSLTPDYKRRIGLAVDEIPTLNEIPSLLKVINLGRKYGIVPMIGYQSYYLLEDKYGEKKAKALIDAMSVFAAFRCNGNDGAKKAAEQLGTQEIEQGLEGNTFGQADLRDATSVNRQAKDNRNLVLPSEIQALQDEECYVNFHRGIPVTKVRLKFKKPEPHQAGFIDNGVAMQIDARTLEPFEQVENIDEYLDRIEEEVKKEQEEALAAQKGQVKPEPVVTQNQDVDSSTFIS